LTDYVTNQALNGVLKWWLSKKKISEQILAPEPLFYYKSFALQDKRYNSSYSYPSHLKLQKAAVDRDIKHP
jgi:hypothetical protein